MNVSFSLGSHGNTHYGEFHPHEEPPYSRDGHYGPNPTSTAVNHHDRDYEDDDYESSDEEETTWLQSRGC